MEINKEKIRYILQYYYDKGKNAAQACEKICTIYGEDTLSKSIARKWFARFHIKNFDVKDELAPVDQSLKSPMKSWKKSSVISM